MRGDISQDSRKDPETLEREIDATRARLEDTLGALEERLSPHRLFDLALGQFREHGGEFAGNLGSSLKENPVPLILTSVGVAWMMANDRRRHDGDDAFHASGSGGSGRGRQLAERARGAGGALKQRGAAMRRGADGSRAAISGSAARLRSRAGGARQAAGERAGQARAGFDRMLREQPLVLGAIGLAAGAVIGAALPPTEAEDSLMGPARDRVKDRAETEGKEAYSRVRERTEETVERAKRQMESGGAHDSDSGGGADGRQPAAQQAASSQPPSSSTPRG